MFRFFGYFFAVQKSNIPDTVRIVIHYGASFKANGSHAETRRARRTKRLLLSFPRTRESMDLNEIQL